MRFLLDGGFFFSCGAGAETLNFGVTGVLIFAVGVECGENRGGNGGEPGAPKRTGGEPGAFGKRTGGEPGAFGIHLQRVPGEKRGLWDKNRGRTGGREFSLKQETQLGT